jgi:RNA polymerase sigma factor (sigma-70 family)
MLRVGPSQNPGYMSRTGKDHKAARKRAFELIVGTYEGPLLRYATRILQRHEAAQDVVQDTFIRLFEHWKDELAPCPQISSWLYRVAHNRSVDYLRKESRRQQLHQKHAEEADLSIPPDRGKGFRLSAEAARAAAALGILSIRERQLVVLKVYEEKSYKEISEITGLTVSNVGYILHHAMKKMARALKEAADS